MLPLSIQFFIITVVPELFQHQQQVATAVERAKQVTMTELNAIIGVSRTKAILNELVLLLCFLLSITYL